MKKILTILLVIILASCLNKINSPKELANEVFNAIKTNNEEAFKKCYASLDEYNNYVNTSSLSDSMKHIYLTKYRTGKDWETRYTRDFLSIKEFLVKENINISTLIYDSIQIKPQIKTGYLYSNNVYIYFHNKGIKYNIKIPTIIQTPNGYLIGGSNTFIRATN